MKTVTVWAGGKSRAKYPLIEIEHYIRWDGERDGWMAYTWHKGRRNFLQSMDDSVADDLIRRHLDSGNRIAQRES